MRYPVKKAVFPVAGLGSRFLPATKANPKEMLPIVDKPLIHYAVEEALEAGMTDLIFITSAGKHSIENYFDSHFELETRLERQNKEELLNLIRNMLPSHVNCIYLRQPQPLGLGDAVLRAKAIVGDEPFAVLLADDLIDCPEKSCLNQMCDLFTNTEKSVIAVEKIAPEDTDKYGVIDFDKASIHENFHRILSIVEKPKPELAPSNIGVAGRYILTPTIFSCLEKTAAGKSGEIQLTDAIALLLQIQDVYALEFTGKRYDCGSKFGYMQANLIYALKHPEIGSAMTEFLTELSVMRELKKVVS